MDWKGTLLLIALVIVYLLLGGLAFYLLERNHEEQVGDEMQDIVNQFLASYPSVPAQNVSHFVQQMRSALQAGYWLSTNGTVQQPAPKWDYHSSVFFSITVMTTIGYGNISPTTIGGRIFFVAYGMFGIPLLGVLLGIFAAHLAKVKARLETAIVARCSCCGSRAKTRFVTTIGSIVYMLVGGLIFLVIPSIIFSTIENWTMGEAFYYSFVTLSTVGFGDYVAGQQLNSVIFKLALVLWIFFGLVYISGIITCIQSVIESKAAVISGEDEDNSQEKEATVTRDEGEAARTEEEQVEEVEEGKEHEASSGEKPDAGLGLQQLA